MKKLMIVAAAAMGLAAFGDIESTNTVGYSTKEAGKGIFIMLGAQFNEINGGCKVQNVVTGLAGVPYDDDKAFLLTAPQIQIPAGAGYKTYYYLQDGWYDNGTPDGDYKPGWCDMYGSIVDAEYTPGVAIWLKSVGEDAVVTTLGAVPEVNSVSVDCPAVFSMRTYAYPSSVEINSEKIVFDGIAAVAYDDDKAFITTAPQVQIPFGAGYKTYYYLQDGWFDNGTPDGDYKPGWCDMYGSLVYGADATIPVAQGFWLKGVGSEFTVEFVK